MKVLALEAYDGGSHKHFLDGLIRHSRHEFLRLGLPARKWKWRMRGSAMTFAQQIPQALSEHGFTPAGVDLVFTSDMTPVADLRALLPRALRSLPMICYFHENQLTYPLEHESERDYQYGFTNITSALSADQAWFNSRYHLESFLMGVQELLRKMPDFVPRDVPEEICRKSRVMPPGLDEDCFVKVSRTTAKPLVLLWNHRWEYDKNPDLFFEVLIDLDRAGIDFKLIVLGEQFRTSPPIFKAAHTVLTEHILQWGYTPSCTEYLQWLRRADVVVSTADHEFFGIAVLEAIAAGCSPLLPNRLSYPELLPADVEDMCLYESSGDLAARLKQWCTSGPPSLSEKLTQDIKKRAWSRQVDKFDDAFDEFVHCFSGFSPE